MPIVVLMLYDFFVASKEDNENNILLPTHLTYFFLVPIKNNDKIALD